MNTSELIKAIEAKTLSIGEWMKLSTGPMVQVSDVIDLINRHDAENENRLNFLFNNRVWVQRYEGCYMWCNSIGTSGLFDDPVEALKQAMIDTINNEEEGNG